METKKVSKAEQALQDKLAQPKTPVSGIEALLGSVEGSTEEVPTEKAQDTEDTEGTEDAEESPQFAEDLELLAKYRKERYKNIGRPKKKEEDKAINKTKSERFTTIITHKTADKIRTIAFESSLQVKDVVEIYLLRGIQNYEKEHGKIKVRKKGFRMI